MKYINTQTLRKAVCLLLLNISLSFYYASNQLALETNTHEDFIKVTEPEDSGTITNDYMYVIEETENYKKKSDNQLTDVQSSKLTQKSENTSPKSKTFLKRLFRVVGSLSLMYNLSAWIWKSANSSHSNVCKARRVTPKYELPSFCKYMSEEELLKKYDVENINHNSSIYTTKNLWMKFKKNALPPIYISVLYDDHCDFLNILHSSVNLNSTISNGHNILTFTIVSQYGDYEKYKILTDQQIPLKELKIGKHHTNLLLYTVGYKKIKIVADLLKKGFYDINETDENGYCALLVAFLNNDYSMVQLLLLHEAKFPDWSQYQNSSGFKAYQQLMTSSKKHSHIVRYFSDELKSKELIESKIPN